MKKHSGCLILRFSAVGIIKREALTLGREGFPPRFCLMHYVTTGSTASSSVNEILKTLNLDH